MTTEKKIEGTFYPLQNDEWRHLTKILIYSELQVLYHFRTLDPFGDRMTETSTKEVAEALDISQRTVQRSVLRLAELQLIDLEIQRFAFRLRPIKIATPMSPSDTEVKKGKKTKKVATGKSSTRDTHVANSTPMSDSTAETLTESEVQNAKTNKTKKDKEIKKDSLSFSLSKTEVLPPANPEERVMFLESCSEEEMCQREEKANQDSSQSSSVLVKTQKETFLTTEGQSGGQITPAAGAAVENVRQVKYDNKLGIRPYAPRITHLYPAGPWLTDNGLIDEDFLNHRANLWRKGDSQNSKAFGAMSFDDVVGMVAAFYQDSKNHGKLVAHWQSYAKTKKRHLSSVEMRRDAGINIPESEQQEIMAAANALMSAPLEPFMESANTRAFLPQEAREDVLTIETVATSPQRALEGKIEAPISATPTVTMAGVENGTAYQVFKADERSMQQFAQVCQGPTQRVENTTEDRPPTEEELAANVKRVAQMMAKLAGKKSVTPANPEPEKTEFERLKTLVEFARRDPMTIAQVRAAEWREEIEVDWCEEVEVPYPISIKPNLGF